jgi:hypothetical protein
MAEKIAYQVGDEVVASLKEVATLLGVPKVSKKDITGDGEFADIVSLVDVGEMGEEVELDSADESTEQQVSEEDEWEEGYPQGTADTVDPEDIDISPEEMMENLPEFGEGKEGLEEFKEFFKDMDTPTAEYIAKALQLEWKPTDHENIHRMRISMAMQRHFFPELFKPKEKKKKAKYGDFSTEQLFTMLSDNKIDVKQSGNEPIDRMRAIMELKKAGVLDQ